MSAVILRGLLFGDEGKGTITDYLACLMGAKTVVRDSGGPQAGHRVVDDSGNVHTYSQLSSATFRPGVIGYLSDGMLFKVPNFRREAEALEKKGVADAANRVRINPGCALVTPLHAMLNQIKALVPKTNRNGSVGAGVGEAVFDRDNSPELALYVRDCLNEEILAKKLDQHFNQKFEVAKAIVAAHPKNREIADIFAEYCQWMTKKRIREQCESFRVCYGHLLEAPTDFFGSLDGKENLIFEGSQGALLDPVWGYWPHVTKTGTTAETAEGLIGQYLPGIETIKLGILRAYFTRHGFGPFVTEEPNFPASLLDKQNIVHPWQGGFRAGWFDLVAARYGIAANKGVDSLALTNLDRLSVFKRVKACTGYFYGGSCLELIDQFFEWRPCANGARIDAFKPVKKEGDRTGLAGILRDCRPAEYRIFSGWQKPIGEVRQFKDLPKEARSYISFLESEDGLGIPISIISVGERSGQKFINNPLR